MGRERERERERHDGEGSWARGAVANSGEHLLLCCISVHDGVVSVVDGVRGTVGATCGASNRLCYLRGVLQELRGVPAQWILEHAHLGILHHQRAVVVARPAYLSRYVADDVV